MTPLVGPVTMTKVSGSWSASLPVSTMAVGVSSFIVTLWLLATGASLSGVTVRLTVAGTLLVVPSLTRNVIVSFSNNTASAEIYTLPLHDALPILTPLVGPVTMTKVSELLSTSLP